MGSRLEDLSDSVAPPASENPERPIYAVLPIPGYENYFIGKDRDSNVCLLVEADDNSGRMQAPIRLEHLDAQFELRCQFKTHNAIEKQGTFTVIRCRSIDKETIRYFLSVCDTIVIIVGDKPKQRELASAVHRLAAIFQKLQKPPTRSVNGLFGELYLIWRSANAARTIRAWRVDDTARFDFADGDIRIDVKAATGRLRTHTFSYEQCNPPPDTVAVAASLFVERSPDGISLHSIIREIEARITACPDLVVKLHEVVTGTLGSSLKDALPTVFDVRLASSTLKLYDLRKIPAIRTELPAGVSDLHFRSDVSGQPAMSVDVLIEQNGTFKDLLPARVS